MTTTMTLADLAATSLSAIRILEQHGLDYCCGGKQPFDQACLAKGVKPETIIREIAQAKVASAAGRDWQTAPLDELVKHMETTLTKLRKRQVKGEESIEIIKNRPGLPVPETKKKAELELSVPRVKEEITDEDKQARMPSYTTPEGFVVRKIRP